MPPSSPHRSVFSLISQHCPTQTLQPMPNQASGPCTRCPPIPPWAAFPLPFHFFKSFFLHQTFPHSPQRLIFCTINNQGPSLSDPNPASAITFCASQASGYGTPAFPQTYHQCSNLCPFAHTILLPCCLSSFNLAHSSFQTQLIRYLFCETVLTLQAQLVSSALCSQSACLHLF